MTGLLAGKCSAVRAIMCQHKAISTRYRCRYHRLPRFQSQQPTCPIPHAQSSSSITHPNPSHPPNPIPNFTRTVRRSSSPSPSPHHCRAPAICRTPSLAQPREVGPDGKGTRRQARPHVAVLSRPQVDICVSDVVEQRAVGVR